MIKLMKNEWFKIFKKKSTWILLGIWLLSIFIQIFFSSTASLNVALDFSFLNLLITILSASIMSEEFSHRTIKFLLTKTFTRSEILLSKFLSLLSIIFTLNLFQLLVAFVLTFLANNFSDFTPLSLKRICFTIAVTMSVQILYIAMTLLISMVFNSQSIAIAASILVIFLGSMLNALLISQVHSFFILLNPLNMLNITLLTNSETAGIRSLPLWGYLLGIVFYSLLFYLVTYFHFKKKDISING